MKNFIIIFIFGLVACEYQEKPVNLDLLFNQSITTSNSEQLDIIYQKFAKYQVDFPDAVNIDPKEAKSLNNTIYVDVREPSEYEVSIIKNAITKDEFLRRQEEFRNHKVIVYCTIGYRSGIFAEEILRNGFDSFNLLGGVLLWSHFGYDFYLNDTLTTRVHVYSKDWSHLHSDYEALY